MAKAKKKKALAEIIPVVASLRDCEKGLKLAQNDVTDGATKDRIIKLTEQTCKLADSIATKFERAKKAAEKAKIRKIKAAEKKVLLEKRLAEIQAKLDSLDE